MENLQRTNPFDQQAAGELLATGSHYVEAVARMGDDHPINTTADIVESHGIKLLAKGSRIDSSVLDKLLGHRLKEPLDRCLSLVGAESPDTLAHAAAKLIERDPWWERLAARSGEPRAIREGLADLRIPDTVCFKLTVAREQRPELHRHSLRTALLAHYLALRLHMGKAETSRLQLAALCHDLGELHTDPAILDRNHRITEQERHYVYVHPITGYLILRQIQGFDPEVAKAVLQHQERLDGSGYPSGLRGDAISPLARILTVADIAESILDRHADQRRMSTLLRLNLKKYENRAVMVLHEALDTEHGADARTLSAEVSAIDARFARVSELLAQWSSLRSSLVPSEGTGDSGGLDFLFERMHDFNTTLLQCGFDPDSFGVLGQLARSEPEIAGELALVLDEARFQLAEMAREIERRWETGGLALSPEKQSAFAAWRQTLGQVLAGS